MSSARNSRCWSSGATTIRMGIWRVRSSDFNCEQSRKPSNSSPSRMLMMISSNETGFSEILAIAVAGSSITVTSCLPASATLTRSTKVERWSMTSTLPGLVSCAFMPRMDKPIDSLEVARARNSSDSIFRRARLLMRQKSEISSTGFVRKSSAPASRPRTRSSCWSRAVTMMTGICWVAGLALMRLQTSMPSMPGIITSSKIMSGLLRCTASRASTPFIAVTTSKYSAESFASSSRTLARISSTTRMRAVILVCLESCQLS